jgi:hypothetical protein
MSSADLWEFPTSNPSPFDTFFDIFISASIPKENANKYAEKFAESGVEEDLLSDMKLSSLREMGLNLVDAMKMNRWIQKRFGTDQLSTSNISLSQSSQNLHSVMSSSNTDMHSLLSSSNPTFNSLKVSHESNSHHFQENHYNATNNNNSNNNNIHNNNNNNNNNGSLSSSQPIPLFKNMTLTDSTFEEEQRVGRTNINELNNSINNNNNGKRTPSPNRSSRVDLNRSNFLSSSIGIPMPTTSLPESQVSLIRWLESKELDESCAEKLISHKVDINNLSLLNERDLERIGINDVGSLKTLLYEIEQMKSKVAVDPSLLVKGVKLEKELGAGIGGVVFKGHMERAPVALKKLHKQSQLSSKEFFTELSIIQKLHHPNIVTFFVNQSSL